MKHNRFGLNNHNKKVIILGLGKIGQSVLRYLIRTNVRILCYDDNINNVSSDYLCLFNTNPNFTFIKDKHKIKNHIDDIEFAIVSPGIKENNYIVRCLRKNNIPIYDEVEFTSNFIKSPIIAITGTNGKSTTTVLLGKILAEANRKCFWGGNLAPGLPFSHSLLQTPKEYYIIEVSSFQLERCKSFRPHIGILLNISHDHLDRHRTMSEYCNIKFKIFENQTDKDFAIVNCDDSLIMEHIKRIKSNLYFFSIRKEVKGVFLKNDIIYFNNEKICNIADINLKGKQFLSSILAAICAAKLIGIKNCAIKKLLSTFVGLNHRLEFVTENKNVKYINNSMCTNPAAGIETLSAFTQPVILITGGKEKNLPLDAYVKAIIHKAKHTILLGENRFKLYKLLKYYKYKNAYVSHTLKNAIKTAMHLARPRDIILFSPGFASFDMFSNFEERGNLFKKLVLDLTSR
ncbi:MAG: UDP-N-acetylmuramoyl-L-alanine--D-glutamate ligase [candidate division WOR-3 bacterium]